MQTILQTILAPPTSRVMSHARSAYRRFCTFSAILSVMMIFAAIGRCGDTPQYPRCGTTIAVKDNDPLGVSINVRDKAPFGKRASGITVSTSAPRLTLKIGSAAERVSASSAFGSATQVSATSSQGARSTLLVVPALVSPAAKIEIVRKQPSAPLVASRLAPVKEQVDAEPANEASKTRVGLVSIGVGPQTPEPKSQPETLPPFKPATEKATEIVIHGPPATR